MEVKDPCMHTFTREGSSGPDLEWIIMTTQPAIRSLHLNQILIDSQTGQAWKITVIEAISTARRRARRATEREQPYFYGCKALDYDDERVVLPYQIGSLFVPEDEPSYKR